MSIAEVGTSINKVSMSSASAILHRQAERAQAVPLGYFYNAAKYGEPAWETLSAKQRHNTLGTFNFGLTAYEVASEAIAARIVKMLSENPDSILAADLKRRSQVEYRRNAILRRSRVQSLLAKARNRGNSARVEMLEESLATITKDIESQSLSCFEGLTKERLAALRVAKEAAIAARKKRFANA